MAIYEELGVRRGGRGPRVHGSRIIPEGPRHRPIVRDRPGTARRGGPAGREIAPGPPADARAGGAAFG